MSPDPQTQARRRRAGLEPVRPGGSANGNGAAHSNGNGRTAQGLRGGGDRGSGGRPRTRSGGGGSPLRRQRASLYRPRKRPRRHRALRITLFVLAILIAMTGAGTAVAFAGYNIFKGQLPDPATITGMEPSQDSYVYDGSGALMHVYHDSGCTEAGNPACASSGSRHTHVALANISRWARLATIDIEDRHFYSEGSWDLPRLFAAGVNDITHSGSTQGASTITQQLAKLSFAGTSAPRSLDYKIKEIVLGNEIAANFTKDQVLEMYLNRIYYGNFSVGIETAAQLYFFTDAKKLDLAQASMLAGLPQSPAYFNPLNDSGKTGVNPLAKQRQREVLNAMVNNGDITQAQADAAYKHKLTFHSWRESEPNSAPSFVDYLTHYLSAHFGDQYIKPGGWRIYTTLNPGPQSIAEGVVHQQILQNADQFNMHDAALVSIDPRNGEVIDMVGAWDYTDRFFGQLNMTTQRISPGSTIKLFTYTAAIASGKFTMTTPILDAPYTWHLPDGRTYAPLDYDRRWHGTCQLKACLGNSLNVPAVKVEVGTGIPYINSFELAAGVASLDSKCTDSSTGQLVSGLPNAYQYSATLGSLTCGITLLDLANGAATIANMGVEHDATPVIKIEDAKGKLLYVYDPDRTARRVLPSNVAFIMNTITSNDLNRVNEFGAHGLLTIPGRRVSAKTGTAENFADNLTLGWTPELLTAVWVGNPSPFCTNSLAAAGEPCGYLNGIASGITGAAPIWHDFMSTVLPNTPNDWYVTPNDVIQRGSSSNPDYFLPNSMASPGTCYYWGPSPDPNNQCQYTGTGPPPWYNGGGTPTPGPAAPTPTPRGPHGPPPTPPAG